MNREAIVLVLIGLFIGTMAGKIILDRIGPPEPRLHNEAKPYHGLVEVASDQPRMTPFRIITPPGSRAYVVKLVDAETNEPVMRIFLEAGRTFETLAPIGSFKLKWATGRNWRGENQLFGSLTDYQEAIEPLVFEANDSGYAGHTVELEAKVDGNMHSDRISPTGF